jgi:3-methylfumaryl-CoA hydratase
MRTSRVTDISQKTGRSGPLVFVRVEHEIANADGVALRETHEIVYRDLPRAGATCEAVPATQPDTGATPAPQFSRTVAPDPVLLFRYSALTFNGHRIHYDRSYVHEVEGYLGLVVHGPLIATLLVDLLRRERPGQALAEFSFKALQPLFDTTPFTICGRVDESGDGAALWALDAGGRLAMQATARFAG